MFTFLRNALAPHPILRQAILWALPAIAVGAVLRLLFLSYMPFAYWGSDSMSYYSFAHQLLGSGDFSLNAKRRFVYPILMLPVTLLPGEPLRWLAWLQHGLGLASLVPLSYILRKTLVFWKSWTVPVTVAYAGLPILLWFEHELLGETFFFACLLWAFAGWVAWVKEERLERARRLFWWFFVPLALFVLTKPSARFAWPGIFVALLIVCAWRRLTKRQMAALAGLILVMPAVGSSRQGAWLLYVSVFPLTQLDSPLHAEYKAEIRDLVEPLRRDFHTYYAQDKGPFRFLASPGESPERPLWAALENEPSKRAKIYTALALEGIRSEPLVAAYFGLQRMLMSCNPSFFKEVRFEGPSYAWRFENDYARAQRKDGDPVRMAFALPKKGPLPPFEEFRLRLNPHVDSWMERALSRWIARYHAAADLIALPPKATRQDRGLAEVAPTALGLWLVVGMLLSLLPRYRSTLGVGMIIAGSYLALFLVSQMNSRYFAPAWPLLFPLLAVPADVLVNLIASAFRRSSSSLPKKED